jgi:hypothetical protein
MNTLSVGALTRFLPFLISYRPESIFAHTTPVTLNDRFAPRRTNANVALGTSRQLLRRATIARGVPKTLRKRGLRNPTMALFGVSENWCSEYSAFRNTSDGNKTGIGSPDVRPARSGRRK